MNSGKPAPKAEAIACCDQHLHAVGLPTYTEAISALGRLLELPKGQDEGVGSPTFRAVVEGCRVVMEATS